MRSGTEILNAAFEVVIWGMTVKARYWRYLLSVALFALSWTALYLLGSQGHLWNESGKQLAIASTILFWAAALVLVIFAFFGAMEDKRRGSLEFKNDAFLAICAVTGLAYVAIPIAGFTVVIIQGIA